MTNFKPNTKLDHFCFIPESENMRLNLLPFFFLVTVKLLPLCQESRGKCNESSPTYQPSCETVVIRVLAQQGWQLMMH